MGRPPDAELAHNTALIADPARFAREHDAASWLHLCGEEFAAMGGAPFVHSAETRAWVEQRLARLARP